MDIVEITLPVSTEAAKRLHEPDERARLGALLSLAIASEATASELAEAARLFSASQSERRTALRTAFADIQEAAAATGITPEDIEDELAAWKRERAARLPGDATARRS